MRVTVVQLAPGIADADDRFVLKKFDENPSDRIQARRAKLS